MVSLELVDISITYPQGIIEDVLVKEDKFNIFNGIYFLDMEEDLYMPLILRRTFLTTRKTLIDVQIGKLILQLGEDKLNFNVFKALKHPHDEYMCFSISCIDFFLC